MTSQTSKTDRISILLVLENAATLNLVTNILQPQPLSAFGLNILGTTSADEATDALKFFVPHVMVVDLDMPDGWGLALGVIRQFPEIDLIAITTSDQQSERARRHGIENVLNASGNEDLIDSLLFVLGVEEKEEATGPDLLIVGRNDDELATLFALLRHSGYRVAIAETAAAALDSLEQNPETGVMIVDLLVPGGGAMELLEESHSRFAGTGKIALTGFLDGDLARRALSSGAFECLVKPLEADRVISAVEACLAHVEYRSRRPWWKRLWEDTA
jgi:DNA-binding NtrC family response regulator